MKRDQEKAIVQKFIVYRILFCRIYGEGTHPSTYKIVGMGHGTLWVTVSANLARETFRKQLVSDMLKMNVTREILKQVWPKVCCGEKNIAKTAKEFVRAIKEVEDM